VRLDRDKLARYAELYKELGPYPYDQDPLRPGWAPTLPNNRWADPADDRRPALTDSSTTITTNDDAHARPPRKG
jgi:hypothetical protein